MIGTTDDETWGLWQKWQDDIMEAILAGEQAGTGCGNRIGPYPCCSVVQGDCLELMRQLPDGCVDAVITDPPYGISLENHARGKQRRFENYLIAGDGCSTVAAAVLEWARAFEIPTCAFASPWNPWPGTWRNLLVWDKGPAVGGGGDTSLCFKRTWELIQIRDNKPLQGLRDSSVLTHWVTPQDTSEHIAAKPVELMEYLEAKLTEQCDTILDPFCGSGTTLVAAKKLGRHFLGFEISAEYCAIARRRLDEIDAQPNLFAPKPEQLRLP